MSKIIYICYRDFCISSKVISDIHLISGRLAPDNIIFRPPKILTSNGIAYGIINPVDSVEEINGSVAMGKVFTNSATWSEPLKSYPDGSFALFRQNNDYVELVTDVVASRTIWYYQNDSLFIASTSQRAIIMTLQDFKFDKKVLTWILSTGSLGPDNSWDSRIKQVLPDSSVILDRRSWEVEIKSNPIEFRPTNLADAEHISLFKASIVKTFKSIDLNLKKWVLPLSGGYDSRCILIHLYQIRKDISGLRTITWGLANRLKQRGTDAFVAKQLADYYRLPNEYLHTDRTSESIEQVFRRFFIAGEGRIDHVVGYLDGFRVWKYLYEEGIEGIIRGDVGLTSKPAQSADQVRKWQGFSLCSEFSNLKDYQVYGFPKQEIPARFMQKSDETLEQWRDRLYQQFRIPTILSALSDLKLSYIEVINPLLSKKVIMQIRSLPDNLKDQKNIFKNLVDELSPNLGIARDAATEDKSLVFGTAEMYTLLSNNLNSEGARSIFPQEFLEFISKNMRLNSTLNDRKSVFKSFIKRHLSPWLKTKFTMATNGNMSISFNKLAFRVYLIVEMHKLLTEDASCESIPANGSSQ